ncbi:tetratricopeptide repeat protein [Aureitalea sp. L0-47]|uniref:tetratricopeptide repeat protein n=1 Tax=Aureitalea sp. L0-47 TaxID=2816962 RepID=UPI00223897B4|nr:tetratricopeptide repeat protein [Aureitalea sp. L0-47]MCW5518598.1 tetratricopeptide repeat protein [Aureitalea sp. L0-47]
MNLRFLIIAFLFQCASIAQDMNSGFVLLETGRFSDAESYFEDVLTQHPGNKTARLCYGRAVGLNGRPGKAKRIFDKLLLKEPNDLELKLNYAESLLWNKEFFRALKYYETLMKDYPEHPTILLGYANTLSNLKKYEEALEYINMLIASDSVNTSARISRKFIRLGLAGSHANNGRYTDAENLLQSNLEEFNLDPETQLGLADLYLQTNDLSKAEIVYTQISDSVVSYTGLSLVEHRRNNNKKALQWAAKAKNYTKDIQDEEPKLKAQERFIQALLWNKSFRKATSELDSLERTYPDDKIIMNLKASIGLYTGDFRKSIDIYRSVLKEDSLSFDANLGLANAYRANGNLELARRQLLNTLNIYVNQKDAIALLQQLEQELQPTANSSFSYSSDNGNNIATNLNSSIRLPISFKTHFNFAYSHRSTENSLSGMRAGYDQFSVGSAFRIRNNTWVKGNIGLLNANTSTSDYTNWIGSVFLESRPLPKQFLRLGYTRELQNFNAALVAEKILMSHYMLNYNLSTNFGLGWFTSYTYTAQTDANTRNLLFTSLYYQVTDRPLIKTGLNFQYISFKEQRPELYFSPYSYQATEIFAEMSRQSDKWSFAFKGAAGLQFVESQEATSTYRLDAAVNFSLGKDFTLGAFGKYSNIASAVATGFEYTEMGVRLRWNPIKNVSKRLVTGD